MSIVRSLVAASLKGAPGCKEGVCAPTTCGSRILSDTGAFDWVIVGVGDVDDDVVDVDVVDVGDAMTFKTRLNV